MAPLSRPVHLFGMGLFAIGYGVVRAVLLFGVVAAFFALHLPRRELRRRARAARSIASISFIGIGMMTAVLPLISPEKGTQLGFVAQGAAARRLGRLLPGLGAAAVDAGALGDLAGDLRAARHAARRSSTAPASATSGPRSGPLLVIGAVSVPLGLWIFRTRRALRQEAREAEAVGMIRELVRGRRRRALRLASAAVEAMPRSSAATVGFLAALAGDVLPSSSGSAPGGSRCRSRSAACACRASTSRRTWSRSCAEARRRASAVTIGGFAHARRRDVRVRLPRLQHDQQPDDAGRAGGVFEKPPRTSSRAAASSSRSAFPTAARRSRSST